MDIPVSRHHGLSLKQCNCIAAALLRDQINQMEQSQLAIPSSRLAGHKDVGKEGKPSFCESRRAARLIIKMTSKSASPRC